MCTWTRLLIAAILNTGILSSSLALASDPADDLESIAPYQKELELYWDAGDYVKALPAAEMLVKLVERMSPADPYALATPLFNLAVVQRLLQQYDESERNFTRSVELIEESQGQYSPVLVSSLGQLGVLHYETQRYDDSLGLLRRAQHIAHRIDGVYTLKQLTIVDWITKVNLATNRFMAADVQQKFAYRISVDNYGEDDQRMIPAMSKLGNWQRDTGQYRKALRIYRKALAIIEANYSDSDLQLVAQLRAISATMYLQGICCADEPLDRALDIVAREPSTDAADELQAIIHLADMNLLTRNGKKAKNLYRRAWGMLADEGRANHVAEQLFAAPTRLGVSRVSDVVSAFRQADAGAPGSIAWKTIEKPKQSGGISFSSKKPERVATGLIGMPLALCYPQVLDLAKVDSREDLSEYYMDLDFSVNPDGQVKNVAVVETNAPSRLSRYVKNILRLTRFRPRLEAGEAVLTDNINLRQTFTRTPDMQTSAGLPHMAQRTAVSHGCHLLAASSSAN